MGRPRAVVVLTGSELVRGDKADGNGAFLARELTRLGLEPARILLVGDEPGELERAAREAGRELRVDERLAKEIEAVSRGVAERLGRPYGDFAPGVRKQASLPDGAVSLGLAGRPPAVLLERDGRVGVALPGPPAELRRLWPLVVASEPFARVVARAERPRHTVLRLFGPSESAVARVLEEEGGEGDGLDVTVCAQELEIRVDLFARGGGEDRAGQVAAALRERFERELFAEDERTVGELVLGRCRELGLRLATAESCTGGLVGARLTDVAGASQAYAGGVVAYSDELKTRLLGVPAETLDRHGAVSAETARAMADGARAALGADVAVAVTGVAGPGGGAAPKPGGPVYVHATPPAAE